MTDDANETLQLSDRGEQADPFRAAQAMLENLTASASVDAVYARPVKNGASVVIPAAEVLSYAGFGLGYSGGKSRGGQDVGSGSGGGGRVLARPVAAIIISDQGVRVEPIVDITKVTLAVLTAGGFVVSLLVRMRGRRPSGR